jgi:hypothetical protein
MKHELEEKPPRQQIARRGSDKIRAWLPLVLSLLSNLFMLGVTYGKLLGRLDGIERRLDLLEKLLK